MKSVKSSWFSANLFFSVLIFGGILFVYLSNEFPPQKVHILIFIPLLIPFFILFNILLIIFYLFKKKYTKSILFLSILLFAGFKYIGRTFQLSLHKKDKEQINIISYNVRVFSAYHNNSHPKIKQSQNSINWIKNSGAQIVCIQEFYTNNRIKDLNTVQIFKKSYPNSCIIPYYDIPPQKIGLAILSKYKILKSGEVKFKSSTFNQAIFADIKISKTKVLRVYNIHLQSMNIDQKIFSGTQIEKELLFTSIRKYKNGALERAEQLKQILHHVKNSPYPTMVCGDFNDVPYSYVYEQFNKHLKNGFEEKGNGFGFTYSGKYSFLRIDNIFASSQINFVEFDTHDSVWGSDHYPISANVFIEN
ncbi:hypothetical protein MYP_4824 [Sporocytophaga myxococcoides]|uniref:Endonuclease/exonuclease/phosphatase domain-containing protein n=1 Tax=Sporocytophaga myxococcoides TaxID=153721 RepID=A0A098LM74_9BACT|nr:endonuclease/exonuclease/phosphatase family protein [Sporocytophaga myxococcoides]GAL87594.1 hypothetical protein MYP_4824 [Sporocytophaga myxococcoides]